jgi:hypothetical protein
MVESQPSKLLVASSILVSRSIRSLQHRAGVAQLVEHLICNQRVGGSNPSASSIKMQGLLIPSNYRAVLLGSQQGQPAHQPECGITGEKRAAA